MSTSKQKREHCCQKVSEQQQAFQIGDEVQVTVTAKVTAISTDNMWLSLSLLQPIRRRGEIWMPTEECDSVEVVG